MTKLNAEIADIKVWPDRRCSVSKSRGTDDGWQLATRQPATGYQVVDTSIFDQLERRPFTTITRCGSNDCTRLLKSIALISLVHIDAIHRRATSVCNSPWHKSEDTARLGLGRCVIDLSIEEMDWEL